MLSRFDSVRYAIRLAVILAAFAFVTGNACAQGQVGQIAPGNTALIYNTVGNGGTSPSNGTWQITNSSGTIVAQNGATNGWGFGAPVVTGAQAGASIGVPAGTSPGQYGYLYFTNVNSDPPKECGGTFLVVPPKPNPADGTVSPYEASAGAAYPWQASVGGVNTANGNKTTVIPITGFTVPGGMSISLALTHNSQSYYSNFNGQKWTFSYLDFVRTTGSNATLYWGDGRTYTFSYSTQTGKYSPPPGIYDTLTHSGNTYTLVTQNQITYQFSQPGTGALASYQFLKTITDENGNKIAVNYAAATNDVVTSVSDVNGRSLTFSYNPAQTAMTGVTDPDNRSWAFGYNSTGDLTTVTMPPLNGVSRFYTIVYDPNSHHDISKFTDLNGNTASFNYNFSQQGVVTDTLSSASDPMGNTTTFAYTANTTTVQDPNLHATVFTYANQLVSVQDAAGYTSASSYDAYNTVVQQTDMNKNVTKNGVVYTTGTGTAQVSSVYTTDPLYKSTTTSYSATNKVLSITAPAPNNTYGATVTTTNTYQNVTNGVDALTQATDPNGHVSTVSYAKNSNPGTNTGQWGLPSQTSDALGHTTQYDYDPNGYLNYVTHGTQGDTVTTLYNSIGWPLIVSTYPSAILTDSTSYVYDAWGRVTSVIAPDGTATSTTYDFNGNVLRVEDANANDGALHGGVAWTAGYFGDALQFDGSTGWVDLGNKPDLGFTGPITISALIKPANVSASGYQDIVAHGYDSSGEVALRLNNGSYEIESFNGSNGTGGGAKAAIPAGDQGQWVNLIGTFDGTTWRLYRNGTLAASYSGAGAQGAIAVTSNWALGATGKGTTQNGAPATSRFFNGTIDDVRIFDRAVSTSEVASLTSATGISTVADGLLGYWRLDDGAGATAVDWCHSVTNAYDQDNRLAWTLNGHLDFVQYFYDANPNNPNGPQNKNQPQQQGLLSYKIDGNGHTTYYVYDVDNRPIETIRPDGTTTTVKYDGDGNVQTRLDGVGILTTYTYDADDRLTNAVHTINSNGKPYRDFFGNSNDVILSYYPDSMIAQMTDYTEVTSWNYDNAGNALSIGGSRGTVSYTYYNNDLRQTMSELSPAEPSPVTWQYAYDDANRPQTLADPFNGTILFGFDMAGRLTTKTFPNGTKTTIGYDSSSEVTGVTTADSHQNLLTGSSYFYDLAGNVTSRTDSDGTAAGFSYNGADQLTFETYAQSGNNSYIGYSYDHNGNRTSQTNSGAVTGYSYDAGDKLTSDTNGGSYSYDGNGNWTQLAGSASTYTFTYDAENRLDYYTAPSMSSAYSYNGMGLRVAESDSGSGEHDLINDGTGPGSSLLVDHTITAKTVAHVFTPGLEQRDGLNGALHLFGVDALGSVRALINDDSQQMVTDTLSFDAYGITRTRTATDGTPFGFAGAEGYQTDPNELMLLGNREYHPFTGRFLTRDPAHAGDNDYEYADDNPLSYVDPSGLDFTDSNGNVWHDIGPSADPNVSRMVIGSGDDGESIIEAEGAGHPGNTLLRVGDSLLLNGAGSHYASVSSAYIRGDVGLGALVGASVLLVGAAAINLLPGEEEGNAALHGAEEVTRLAEKWSPGTFETVGESLAYHFNKHGEEVGAENLLQYLRKADAFSQSLKRASTATLDNGYRYTKAGRYIIKDFEGKILSFGAE